MSLCSEGGSWCSALPDHCNVKLLSLAVKFRRSSCEGFYCCRVLAVLPCPNGCSC